VTLPRRRALAGRLSEAELLDFTDMAAALLEAGLGLYEALSLIASMGRRGAVSLLAGALAAALGRGESLSSALASRPESFPPIYRGMVAIGERIGSVESVVPQLARLLRERSLIRERTRTALAYPALVLALTLLGGLAAVAFLLPRMEELFTALGGKAAADMRSRGALLAAAARVVAVLVLCASACFPAMAALRRGGTPLAERIDRFLLALPVIGSSLLAYEAHNFSFAMEALARGGVPMELALAEAAEVAGNRAFRAAVLRARTGVLRGGSLSAAFRAQVEFPDYMSIWIALGEGTGQVDRVFAQIARYFRGELERRAARYLAALEPALIVLVGAAVLLLVLFFIVPLFEMYGSVL